MCVSMDVQTIIIPLLLLFPDLVTDWSGRRFASPLTVMTEEGKQLLTQFLAKGVPQLMFWF